MAFFNKIKNIFNSNENIINEDKKNDNKEEHEKSIGDTVIEKSLFGVRKYYEFKIKIINKITNVDAEWEFYDKTVIENRVNEIKKKIEKSEHDKCNMQNDIEMKNTEIRELSEELYNYEIKKKELEQSIIFSKDDNDKHKIRNKIDLYNKVIDDNNNRINLNKENITDLLMHIDKVNNDIADLYYLIVTEKSYIENSYNECRKICDDHNIENNFTRYALEAIKLYDNGNYAEAKKYVIEYFNSEQDSDYIVHNPIIDGLYAKSLMEQKDYYKAKKFIEFPLKYYPDSLKIHEMLKEIHEELGETAEAELEKNILELLC